MNKLISKIVGACLGLSLATGVGVGVAVGQNNVQEAKAESTTTYVFNSKSWGATSNGDSANWTSGKDGNQLTSGQGVQITTGVSGANATSPSSFTGVTSIDVKYCTNASNGVGAIKIQVGTGTEKSFSVTKPSSGGTTLKTASFTFSPSESGKVKITGICTTNSVFIYSVSITAASGGPQTQTGSGTANFGNGTGDITIDDANSSGLDTLGNTWNVAVVGTDSFTQDTSYSQVGSSKKPASSIILTCNFTKSLNVTAMSAKFGGNSGTAGTISLKAGDTTIGTGSLNATTDITVSANSNGTGQSISVTITSISKGVKIYYISYTISEDAVEEKSVESLALGEDVSLAKGQTHQLVPVILPADATNKAVAYTNTNPSVASVSETGLVTALAIGSTTITCTSDDNSSASDSILVTVTKAIPASLTRGAPNNYFEVGTVLNTYFTESVNTLSVKYSDNTTTKVSITSSSISLKIGETSIAHSYSLQASDNGKKLAITYTEDSISVFTNVNLVVTEALTIAEVTKDFANSAEYLIVNDDESTLKGTYVSLYGQPTLTVSSSVEAVIGLDSDYDEVTYDASKKSGTFTIQLFAYKTGVSTINIQLEFDDYVDTFAVESIAVRSSAPISGGYYEKITSVSDITDGQYLVVDDLSSKAFNSGLSTLDAQDNFIDVTINNDDTIDCTAETTAAQVTIDTSHNYIKAANGKYISGTANDNALNSSNSPTTAGEHTFSFDGSGNLSIISATSNLACNRNNVSGEIHYRFRYAKSSSTYKTTNVDGWHYSSLYKLAEAVEDDFDKALEFVNTFMHTEISVSDKGTGACITSGWYTAAKAAFLNTNGSTDTGYLQSAAQRAEVVSSFSEYFARLQAWAAANDEEFELSNGDYIVVSASNRIFPTFSGESDAAIPAIVVVIALATVTTGAYFFLRKKKEN